MTSYLGVRGVVTEAFCAPLSQLWVFSHDHHHKSSFLALHVSGSMDRGYPHCLWHQYRPWISTWPQVPGQASLDITMASGGGTDHGHPCSLWWWHGPRTSTQPPAAVGLQTQTWPLAAAWTMSFGVFWDTSSRHILGRLQTCDPWDFSLLTVGINKHAIPFPAFQLYFSQTLYSSPNPSKKIPLILWTLVFEGICFTLNLLDILVYFCLYIYFF